MNNNAPTYLPRWLAPRLHAGAREARITVLTGARQVGKSTLLAHELGADWIFHSLDDLDVQAQAQRDPELLFTASKYVVLDEAHAVPAIFPLIKANWRGMQAFRNRRRIGIWDCSR